MTRTGYVRIWAGMIGCWDAEGCLTLVQDSERKKESESMLGSMTDDKFHQLLSLSKKITDYTADRDTAGTRATCLLITNFGRTCVDVWHVSHRGWA